MSPYYETVKNYLLELDFEILQEDENDGLFVVESEDSGMKNVVLIVADPILIVEQFLFEMPKERSNEIATKLLSKNRDIIHGAFAMDQEERKVYFRNTHECENLDLNELEATLNSLALMLSEYSSELIEFSK
ncbi:MAG: YbjN domain-containing protein [Ekhidna sp.]|nr:YbjN domain-containing protein [Ekhidna sp.]